MFSKVYLYESDFPFRNEHDVPFPEGSDVEVTAKRFSGTQTKAAAFTQFLEVKNDKF